MASLEKIYKVEINKGVYSCGDLGISLQDWIELLKAPETKQYLDTLLCFLREPEHASSCLVVSQKYGKTAGYYNAKVMNFSKWVQRKLNRFQVIGTDDKITYWSITMQKGWDTNQGFKWQLRNELVEALQRTLMEELVASYRKKAPFKGFEEEYKWALLDQTEGKDVLAIIEKLRGQNIIDNARVDGVLKYLCENKPSELAVVLSHLIDESIPIDNRIADFKTEMREISLDNWKIHANDERTAAAILMCKNPKKYTVYKDEMYQLICRYFGFDVRKVGKKFSHFIEIIDNFTEHFGQGIQAIILPLIDKYKNKPLNLAVQTLFWCMRNEMKKKLEGTSQTYWLAGYSLEGDKSQLNRFLQYGIWECGYDETRKSDQQLLEEAKAISEGDIIILKSSSTKGPKHNQPFLRIKAVGVVLEGATLYTNEIGDKRCKCKVEYISTNEKDFDGKVYGSFRKTLHRVDEKVKDIIDYVNKIINEKTMSQQGYKEYIEILLETHNLVLYGAPGTGKTYLAHAIAKEMGAITKFVQFHPSYDYTDFVEGLRPVKKDDKLGFERQDGVFKKFCKEALSLRKIFQDTYDEIATYIKNGEKSLNTKKMNFIVIDGLIRVRSKDDPLYDKKTVSIDTIWSLYEFIVIHFDTFANVESISRKKCNEISNEIGLGVKDVGAYVVILLKELIKRSEEKLLNISKGFNYVFIIDEINRGEVSKIFGELFYAIDPSYRGKQDNLVQTQYQNLIPETDVFAKGFFVPKNVYILATMNDIDRSVESMDFAMRRRFTWKEITPNDTESMLDDLTFGEEAKNTMHRLNSAIAETEGLGSAYMIGPSYFLKLGENGGDFIRLWRMNIEPLLKEYLRGFRKANEILNKFKTAYFNNEEIVEKDDNLELTDEN